MNSGVRVCTDRATFERWARALSGLALPRELISVKVNVDEPISIRTGQGEVVPPVVAASLALHGCADVAVTVRLTMPTGEAFGCFGLSGDLGASLIRRGDDLEIGLFGLEELVEQVAGMVPLHPPPPVEAASGCVRIAVMGADAAVAGWQQILIGGENHWCRMQSGVEPHRLIPVPDVRRELAADLRFAIADTLAADGRGDEGDGA